MISSMSSEARASLTALSGSSSNTSPCGGNPGLAECRECPVEAPTGCRTSRVAVDDVPGSRLGHRSDHSDANRSRFGTTLHRGDELWRRRASRSRRRGSDGRSRHACTSSASRASFCGAMTACRAPGTPYSYGPPTTCGISSKLKMGGGEETCHSSVSARHGIRLRDRAARPARHDVVDEHDERDAEHERGDRDDEVHVAERLCVVGHATRHPSQTDVVHREERRVEAHERHPEVDLPEPLVVHPAGHLREPVVDAREDREHRAAEEHVVDVRDDEVRVRGVDRRSGPRRGRCPRDRRSRTSSRSRARTASACSGGSALARGWRPRRRS